jgi:nitric oxide reductase NorD protein
VAPAAEPSTAPAAAGWRASPTSARKAAHAARDDETLRLPAEIALFPERSLNRDLYLWLIAQGPPCRPTACRRQLDRRQPGRQRRPWRPFRACVALPPAGGGGAGRAPDPRKLPADEAAAERAIRQALAEPGSVAALPAARRPPTPVALWLYPAPVALDRRQSAADPTPAEHREGSKADATDRRRQAQRKTCPTAATA